jgi:hypothetical protein
MKVVGTFSVMVGSKMKIGAIFIVLSILSPQLTAYAFDASVGWPDGSYDATVDTDSGSYTEPVEVIGGEVTCVQWPNGGCMSLSGASIDENGEASGTNSRGDTVSIKLSSPPDK